MRFLKYLLEPNATEKQLQYALMLANEKIKKGTIKYSRKNCVRSYVSFVKVSFSMIRNNRELNACRKLNVSASSNDKNIQVLSDLPISMFDYLFECFIGSVLLCIFLFKKIEGREVIYSSILKARIYRSGILRFSPVSIRIHGFAYRLDIFFLCFLLSKRKKLTVVYFEGSSFLTINNSVIADALCYRDPFGCKYARENKHMYMARKYLAKITEKNIIANVAKMGSITRIPTNNVAVYTSGFWNRVNHGFAKKSFLLSGMQAENRMLELVAKYAGKHPEIDFVLFVHLKNNIEPYAESIVHYSSILELENVGIQDEQEVSVEQFQNYELGITCSSNIFFDRFVQGYKTVLVDPVGLDDFIDTTGLSAIRISSIQDDAISIIEEIRSKPVIEYFRSTELSEDKNLIYSYKNKLTVE